MNIYFRLYYPADLELMLMRKTMGGRFPGFVKECLHSMINGKPFEYDPPSLSELEVPKTMEPCAVNLALDEKKDADIIAFIQAYPQGIRSGIAKKILCGCAEHFPMDLYLSYSSAYNDPRSNEAGKRYIKEIKHRQTSGIEEQSDVIISDDHDAHNDEAIRKSGNGQEDENRQPHKSQQQKDRHIVHSQESSFSQASSMNQDSFADDNIKNEDDLIRSQEDQKPETENHSNQKRANASESVSLDSDEDMMKALAGIVNHK